MAELQIDDLDGGVRLLTLNDPERLNPLSTAMVDALHEALTDIETSRTIRAVILTGAGRGFCSGADLDDAARAPDPDRNRVGVVLESQARIASAHLRIHKLRVPTIAAVNGVAAGGGFTLTLACDIRIAAESARFGATFIKLGISSADMGCSYFLPRLVGPADALELMLTGRIIDSAHAEKIRLVRDVVPDETLSDRAVELARDLTAHSPLAVWMTKQTMWHNLDASSLARAMEVENTTQTMCFGSGEMEAAAAAFVTDGPVEPWLSL